MLEELPWIFIKNLFLAMLLGGIIGLERSFRNKAAGFRTMMLICIGTTFFVEAALTITANWSVAGNMSIIGLDRILGNIVTGIGFLGAGSIFRSTEKNAVEGLTTAAAIWSVAGIGMLIGLRLYMFAILGTAFVLITLLCFGTAEYRLVGFLREAPKKLGRKRKPR